MEEKDLKFPGFWIPHEIVLNMWGFFLTAAPHAGDDCTDAGPNEDEAWR